ncbi:MULTISPECIES: cell wall metabolism sensor histidine kinase WalK [Anaeromyxobacter]|uniref:sensor histidine kinase n=1 Tax=Anaeromyxobacter TaxID=161492 RepID=UPI001F55E94B|nr:MULTISPECIES: ATP-binding protein [unclassified Anaeromyxobacter]
MPPGPSQRAGEPRPNVSEPPRASRWRRRLPWPPGRIVAAYALLSAVWIELSDRAVELLIGDHAGTMIQTAKGIAFVAVTSVMLYALIGRRERGLRTRGAEIRATIESMADAVLVVDADTQIVEANQAAAELLRVGSREALLMPIAEWGKRFQLRHLDGTPVPLERFATIRALKGERVPAYDAIIRSADGRDVFLSVTASPVLVPGGGTELAVAVLRDVSPARRLDELRDEFLSTAAHEFKTPLAVIKAYAQLLQKRDPGEAQALVVIQRQVDRLNRLVQHLLDTTRLRLDAREGHLQHFDLGALAGEVVSRMRPAAPAHALSVATVPAQVLADRERLSRVITSLVDNAVRYSPGGGAVSARVESRDGEAIFSVEDHGLGIPPERQARIFERYYRAHAGTPQDYGGLGLGLDMSREIVALHGGRMWFESAPGRGSTFHFSVPLAGEGSA